MFSRSSPVQQNLSPAACSALLKTNMLFRTFSMKSEIFPKIIPVVFHEFSKIKCTFEHLIVTVYYCQFGKITER